MSPFRQILVTAIVAMSGLLQSCTTSPSALRGLLVGRFGGVASELVASATDIRVRLRCEVFTAVGPIVPDSLGRFELELKPHPNNPSLGATMTGVTDGATVDASVVLIYSVGPLVGQFQVRRGVKPDDRVLSCVVPRA